MKQLIPTDIDEYIAEHKPGDTVSGRVVESSPTLTVVELGDGIRAACGAAAEPAAPPVAPEANSGPRVDLSSLSLLLKARWQGNAPAALAQPEPLSEGQIRSFKIVKLDPEAKKIEVELV
jgi:small subunit ribosomal protein S1